jgi:hypothetical protein
VCAHKALTPVEQPPVELFPRCSGWRVALRAWRVQLLHALTRTQVEEFMLWDVEAVAEVLSSGDAYKPNCGLVIIDFFVRHGFISPDEPGYVDLVAALRQGAPR